MHIPIRSLLVALQVRCLSANYRPHTDQRTRHVLSVSRPCCTGRHCRLPGNDYGHIPAHQSAAQAVLLPTGQGGAHVQDLPRPDLCTLFELAAHDWLHPSDGNLSDNRSTWSFVRNGSHVRHDI